MKEYDAWYAGKVLCSFFAPSQDDATEMVEARYGAGVFGYPEAVLVSK